MVGLTDSKIGDSLGLSGVEQFGVLAGPISQRSLVQIQSPLLPDLLGIRELGRKPPTRIPGFHSGRRWRFLAVLSARCGSLLLSGRVTVGSYTRLLNENGLIPYIGPIPVTGAERDCEYDLARNKATLVWAYSDNGSTSVLHSDRGFGFDSP